MRIGRVLPPAAAVLHWRDLAAGLAGVFRPRRAIEKIEGELRDYFGVRHVFLVSSGTAALVVALKALKTDASKTDVIVPAYTCFAVPAAIVRAGLRPVPCDINPATFDFDRMTLERTIGDTTLAVITHHLFGIPSNVAVTRALCQSHGIRIVEDAAQAMGATTMDGRRLGTLGDIGIFSVGRGKNITCGSGGILVTSSDRTGAAIRKIVTSLDPPRRHELLKDALKVTAMAAFVHPSAYWLPASMPSLGLGQTVYPSHIPMHRMSGLQAGLLRHWRERLNESNRRRASAASDLEAHTLRHIGGIGGSTYLRLPVLADSRHERDRLLAESAKLGLGFSRAYPTPIDKIPELQPFLDGRRYPAAQSVADRILTVPTHPFVSAQDRRVIAALLNTQRPARPAA